MTSLLADAARAREDLRQRRPLVLLAAVGGASAALATLVVCLGAAVVGWFLTDAGAHGTPRDALRTGALAWLLGHGSGASVGAARVTMVPLGLAVVSAWTVWRIGARVGDWVSGEGPDADAIADGERDWTVPAAALLLATGYAVVAGVTLTLAGTPATAPSAGRTLAWCLLLGLLVGGPAVAVGSGRAAVWAALLPTTLRAAAGTCRRILLTWLAGCAVVLAAALAADLGTAANVMSQLHTDAGDVALFLLLTGLVVPNALIFCSAYLLGPGFTVGAGTLVSPAAVVLGPLPMLPLLAALPDDGRPARWTTYLVVVAPVLAAVAAVRAQRALPTTRWDEGVVRGLAGGVLAGLVVGALAALAGGAVGPGRMAEVGPQALNVTAYAVTAFGVGGLVGGVAVTGWQRRAARRAA